MSFPYLIWESKIDFRVKPENDTSFYNRNYTTLTVITKQKCSRYFIWSIFFNLNILGNYFLYGAVGFSVTFIYLVVSLSVIPLLVYLNTSVISEPEIV